MIKIGKWDEYSRVPTDFQDLPENMIIALMKVSELAYKYLQKESITKVVFFDHDVGKSFQHLGLLNEVKEMYVCEGTKTSYSFLHLRIQEFLAAWYIACHPTDKAIAAIFGDPDGYFEGMQESFLSQFLAGMIGCSKMNFKYLTLNKVKCLYEAQDVSSFTRFKDPSFWLFLESSYDMYVFGCTDSTFISYKAKRHSRAPSDENNTDLAI